MAVLVLLAHGLIMAAHAPPALTAVFSQAAHAAVETPPCHDSAAADHGERAGHDAPAHPPAHVTYCPVCLSSHDGKLLGPSSGPMPAAPMAVAVAAPFPPAEPQSHGRPTRPFSARAPPAVV